MDALLRTLRAQQDEMLALLRLFVEQESPSTDKSALDQFGRMVAEQAAELGAKIRFLPARTNGNHLRVEFGIAIPGKGKQILLLGHLDTVWERGTLARMPFRVHQGRAYGPGVFDMKSGIVMALFAIRNLQQMGVPLKKNVVLLLNSDEEIGSPSSRLITEREARKSSAVLVMEPAHGVRGSLKTARKGVGEFVLHVHGRAAHAGIEPEKGASSILEIARQLLVLETLAKSIKCVTINAGTIVGGTRSNVIPADSEAHLDVRVVHIRDQQKIERKLRALRPVDRRTTLTISGGFNRPPMEHTPQTTALFDRARRLAKTLGISLTETAVGGGSDGNFAAALGVPTLDGLGAVGEGAHAVHEHIIVRELPRRAALLAHLIASLATE